MENSQQPIYPIQTRDNSQIIGLAMQGMLANGKKQNPKLSKGT
jgi:hypothetical protein